jgi:hypothetical protein
MLAGQGATTRDADRSDRAETTPTHRHAGAMAQQSGRGDEAAPQMFVRLTGSHLVKPRAHRTAADASIVTA